MTICIAVKYKDKVIIGADTLEVGGNRKLYGTKLVKIKDCIIGSAGLSTVQAIIENFVRDLNWVEAFKMDSVGDARSFVTEVFTTLKDEQKIWCKSDANDDSGGDEILIATPTKIFHANRTGIVWEIKEFAAIGSGSDFAIGCLDQLWNMNNKLTPKEILEAGLEMACKFDVNCGGDLEVHVVK